MSLIRLPYLEMSLCRRQQYTTQWPSWLVHTLTCYIKQVAPDVIVVREKTMPQDEYLSANAEEFFQVTRLTCDGIFSFTAMVNFTRLWLLIFRSRYIRSSSREFSTLLSLSILLHPAPLYPGEPEFGLRRVQKLLGRARPFASATHSTSICTRPSPWDPSPMNRSMI